VYVQQILFINCWEHHQGEAQYKSGMSVYQESH